MEGGGVVVVDDLPFLRFLNNISIVCTLENAISLMTCYSSAVLTSCVYSSGALTVSEGQENYL